MRVTAVPLSLVGLLLTGPSGLLFAQPAEPAPKGGPCAQIAAACKGAGFVPNGAKEGLGLGFDCIRPIITGTPQRKKAAKALPQIDPQVVDRVQGAESELRKGRRGESTTGRTANNESLGHLDSTDETHRTASRSA
jgi:hypothetical protein